MKYFTSVLLISGFVAIAMLGFSFFDHEMHSQNDPCVGSIINGAACPTAIMGMSLHHISALQTLMASTSPNSRWELLLSLFILVSVLIVYVCSNILLPKIQYVPQRLRDRNLYSHYHKQITNSWLSLFELSPAL